MIVTIHQPEHLPWLGFIHKAAQADCLVILDNVQFRKNYFQNRNKVRTASGFSWVTVPVQKSSLNSLINEIKIDNKHRWREKCWKTIYYSYVKASFFENYSNLFESIYFKNWDYLAELNLEIIQNLLKFFDVKTELVIASHIGDISGKSDDLLLSICKKLGAGEYVSGISGKDYLDVEKFEQAGIKVSFQEFYHPIYQQCHEPFMPCMSSMDLLFNYGDKAKDVLFDADTERLDYIIE